MRNRGLREMNALLDIRSAQADILVDGTSAVFFQGLQDTPPCRVDDGVQDAIQVLLGRRHHCLEVARKLTVVNVPVRSEASA